MYCTYFQSLIQWLLCVIVYSNLTLPLLGKVSSPVSPTVDNRSFVCDANSTQMQEEYQKWSLRIKNGWKAKLGDIPYQISLKHKYRKTDMYVTFCGGSLIGKTKVLSAAHCFDDNSMMAKCARMCQPGTVSQGTLRGTYAVGGILKNFAYYRSDGYGEQWRKLETVKYPKKFKFPANDIAVVITKDPFIHNKYIKPIPIASKRMNYAGSCLASGYGRTGFDTNRISYSLLYAHLKIISPEWCSSIFKKNMDAFICTSSMITDIGKGDSGGPFVCAKTGDPNEKDTGVLVGVASGTIKGSVSIFTRVTHYNDFIDSISSVSMTKYEYNMQTCTAITVTYIYKTFRLF